MTATTNILDNVLVRIEQRYQARVELHGALDRIMHGKGYAYDAKLRGSGLNDASELIEAARIGVVHAMIMLKNDMALDLQQAAHLIVRDFIVPVARESKEPVAWLTGNSMMPPVREVTGVEWIWKRLGDTDEWVDFGETIDRKLDQEQVYMASPEYDNSLYVVDLRRFEYVPGDERDDDEGDDINDEWRKKDG